MSSIPELLRKGFENDDWSYVSEAHQMLTGEYLLVDESLEPQEVVEEEKEEGFKNRKMEWKDDGSIAANEKVSENPSLGVANPVERTRKAAGNRSKQSGDVRLDRSEKLKDINE